MQQIKFSSKDIKWYDSNLFVYGTLILEIVVCIWYLYERNYAAMTGWFFAAATWVFTIILRRIIGGMSVVMLGNVEANKFSSEELMKEIENLRKQIDTMKNQE